MFKLNENHDVSRDILKRDYIRHSPSEVSTINSANSQSYINMPRGDTVSTLLHSLLDLNFDVFHADDRDKRYADGDDIRLVDLEPIALFGNYKLTSSNGKHIEEISHAQIACLLNKLLSSSEDGNDLSIGFDKDRNRRQRELTNKKNIMGKFHVRIMLRDIFAFAEHQQKATYGLAYKVSLIRYNESAVLNKGNAISDAKIKFKSCEWLVPQYTPSLKQQTILMNQIVSNVPTELHYVERSVYMQEVKNRKLWQFHLGTEEGLNMPIFIIIGFQQQDRENSQILNIDTFCRLPVTSAQCNIGSEKNLDSAMLLIYDYDDSSQGYDQIKQAFRALTKDDILQLYVSEHGFRSSNDGNITG